MVREGRESQDFRFQSNEPRWLLVNSRVRSCRTAAEVLGALLDGVSEEAKTRVILYAYRDAARIEKQKRGHMCAGQL